MIPLLLGLRQLACPEELPGGLGLGGMVSVKKKKRVVVAVESDSAGQGRVVDMKRKWLI